jgi:hypothetical protein
LIGLYAQSDKIADFIFNTEIAAFEGLISSSSNLEMLKQIFSAMAYIFSLQKGAIKPVEVLLAKLKALISSKNESVVK